jgi:hypothetical protein
MEHKAPTSPDDTNIETKQTSRALNTSQDKAPVKLDRNVTCLPLRVWFILSLVGLVIQIVVMIGSLSAMRWSEQGSSGNDRWEGGLLRVEESDVREIDQESFNEVANDICDLANRYGSCEMFEDLRDGGFMFIFYEMLSIFAILVWAGVTLSLLCE